MGRAPCCDKVGLKKGPWTPEEDNILVDYINKHGHGSWRSLPKNAGLSRCGKSCRLRWTNYLRPDIKRGPFTPEEERTIIHLHAIVGNRWSTIAGQMPGRTDNEIKNFWNTHLKKRLQVAGVDPVTSSDLTPTTSSSARHMAQWESARLEAEARLSRESLLFLSSTSQPQALDLTVTAAAAAATDTDHFLRMWHSEVGESFRRFYPRSSNGQDGSTYQPAKHTASPAASSSSTAAAAAGTATASTITSEQCGSGSVGHNDMEKKGVEAVVVKREESRTSSNEMEAEEEEDDDNDSHETSLSLLLDFPASDEIDFFQGHLSSLLSCGLPPGRF